MMEKKHQLVAWTGNITDNENARLHMIPSLEREMQADLVTDLTFIHQEEYKSHGHISSDLARRAVRTYEKIARFEILTGHVGDGIRYMFFAANYCIMEDECNWAYLDTDLGSYTYFCGELRDEFVRLCEEGIRLAKIHGRKDILQEKKPMSVLKVYFEHTQEHRDLAQHLKEVSYWK